MRRKENKKITIFPKGSIAVFALILMFILAVVIIGIMATTSVERKSSIATGNSATAFQVAESGMERALQYFKKNFDKKLNEVGSCSGGSVTYNPNNIIRFKDNAAVPAYITDCNELISKVKIIKSIGTTKQETRAIEGDVFLAATKLLLHFNGKNEGGNFEDSSFYYYKNPISANGDVSASDSKSQLGGGSAEFNGTSGYLSVPDSDNWDFGIGDFTIDFWVQLKVLPVVPDTAAGIYAQYHNVNKMVAAFLLNDGGVYKWVFEADNDTVSAPAIVDINKWYHIAYVRKGNDIKIFQDGSLLSTTGSLSGSLPSYNDKVFIGWRGDANNYLNGYLDELRISKGVARWWDSDFVSPTVEYWAD